MTVSPIELGCGHWLSRGTDRAVFSSVEFQRALIYIGARIGVRHLASEDGCTPVLMSRAYHTEVGEAGTPVGVVEFGNLSYPDLHVTEK